MSKSKLTEEQIRIIKFNRAARRRIEIELGLPKEKHKIFKTSKKDLKEKEKNTVRDYDKDQ